jgi:hypothetical protein
MYDFRVQISDFGQAERLRNLCGERSVYEKPPHSLEDFVEFLGGRSIL